MSHLEKLCENHCHLHQSHEQKVNIKQHQVKQKSQEESHSFRKPSIRPSMDWKNKSGRKLPIPIMVPPPPKVISIHPSKLYKNLEAENSNSTGFNHDISPCVAGRRIHKLIENLQFVEGANFIHKLSHSTFKQMMEDEFSFQKLINFIPNSLPVVEAIYSKMFVNSRNEEPINLENLHPQEIVYSLINLFVPNNIPTELQLHYNQKQQISPSMREKILDQSCILSAKRILKVIMLFDKRIRKQIDLKKRKVDRVIRGLGQHGLVGSNHDTLIDLHDAIRIELERVGNQYRTVVQKMNEISDHASGKTSRQVSLSKSCISKGPAPIESSHQRQLSLTLKDVQERLVKNCRLLNMIEVTIGTNSTLQILLDNLRNRIEMDKEAISQVIQVGKLQCNKKTLPYTGQEGRIANGAEIHNPSLDNVVIDPETVLAPILIKYSTAYSKVFILLSLSSFECFLIHFNEDSILGSCLCFPLSFFPTF